jgi:predicted DNA-binding mobile mystery protein A
MAYKKDTTPLARKHLERRLAPLRKANDLARPPRGWIKAIREALGMTTAQLAQRINLTQPRVPQLEKAEVEGGVTLKTLRQVAEGLNCTLVYALVPKQPLDHMLAERARQLAGEQIARTHQTMKLENQALEPRELKAERTRLADELLRGDPRRLWDAP